MPNRTIAPEFHPVKSIDFMKPVKKQWADGAPVWVFHQPGSGVYRLEIIFKSGEKFQQQPLLVRSVAAQLTEGTTTMGAREFAAFMDKLGASVQVETEKDYLSIAVFGLTENAHIIAPVIADLLQQALFPKEELKLYIERNIQRLKINRQKVDVLAREKFAEVLFGPQSPNGKILDDNDWRAVTTELLHEYYNARIKNCPFEVVFSGDCPDDFLEKWNGAMEKITTKNPLSDKVLKTVFTPGKYKVNKPDALQNAIIVAYPVINRTHQDFPYLQMTNLVLGGYFGSRLMSNIREDKGYTYGIGSGIRVNNDHAYLSISTEVGADVCDAALKEIYYEINRLSTEVMGADELELARNYMLGSFIRNSDGALAMADRFKSVHFAGMDYSYYERYLNVINEITAEEIRTMAQRYLVPAKTAEIVAGK